MMVVMKLSCFGDDGSDNGGDDSGDGNGNDGDDIDGRWLC